MSLNRGKKKSSIGLLVCLVGLIWVQLFYSSAVRAQSNPASKAGLKAAVTFRCLWWSENQMDGLNPNSPPPKTTEVVLKKWEYSDPIGVPHPDVVDVVVELGNDTDKELNGLTATISTRWLIGPQTNKAKAKWGKAASVKRLSAFNLAPKAKQMFQIPINLAEQMKRLERTRAWPWRLQALITVATTAGKILLRTQAALPISPGD
jgi:hypothetical protein